jgi:hypothetical protein
MARRRAPLLGPAPNRNLNIADTSDGTLSPATLDGTVTYTFTPAVPNIPEPSTWAMMLVGFAGLGYAALRRKGAVPAISASVRRSAPGCALVSDLPVTR